MNKGRLYGVSVGPGDPELMTLKAKRTIENCPVIAAPRTRSGNMLALSIASGVLDVSQKTILPLAFPMTTDAAMLAQNHYREAMRVAEQLDKGLDVALLNLGDASIYSTFGYLGQIIRNAGYPVEIVPGVPSFCAVAAVLGTGLTEMKKPLHLLPADYGDLADSLGLEGTKVVLKAGKALPGVKQLLREKGLAAKASMVANCGLPEQRIYRDLEDVADDKGYYVTILIKE